MHVHHKTPSAHSDLDLLEVKRKGEDGAGIFQRSFPIPMAEQYLLPPLHLLVRPVRSTQHTQSRQSPYDLWLHGKLTRLGVTSISLSLGGRPQVSQSRVKNTIDMAPSSHSTINHQSNAIPPRRFFNLVEILLLLTKLIAWHFLYCY